MVLFFFDVVCFVWVMCFCVADFVSLLSKGSPS